jgi:thiamine phosphate synthase YjbQ (UPF0047 family)
MDTYPLSIWKRYSNAHLKRQITGREVVVAVTNGNLDPDPWEQIFSFWEAVAKDTFKRNKIWERLN